MSDAVTSAARAKRDVTKVDAAAAPGTVTIKFFVGGTQDMGRKATPG